MNLSTNNAAALEDLRKLGLDRSQNVLSSLGGIGTGIPTHEQTIYAEKRMYSYNSQLMATQANGELIPDDPSIPFVNDFNSLAGMPVLDSVTTWGTMSAITGPSLHCYRVVINRTQNFPGLANVFTNTSRLGESSLAFPPVNVTFLCKDPNYTEGEYLTRLANAMNNIPEDGPTA